MPPRTVAAFSTVALSEVRSDSPSSCSEVSGTGAATLPTSDVKPDASSVCVRPATLSKDFVCPEALFEELDVFEPLLEPVLEEAPFTDAFPSADDEAALPPEEDADIAASEEVEDAAVSGEAEPLPDPETPSSAFSAASAEPAPSSSCASEPFWESSVFASACTGSVPAYTMEVYPSIWPTFSSMEDAATFHECPATIYQAIPNVLSTIRRRNTPSACFSRVPLDIGSSIVNAPQTARTPPAHAQSLQKSLR